MLKTQFYRGEYNYADAMTVYAEEHGCDYLNLFEHLDEIGIDGASDFRDTGHLNDSGAAKVADYLGQYIIDHYEVSDMREIKGNQWEENFRK